jgi:hypothetical protein
MSSRVLCIDPPNEIKSDGSVEPLACNESIAVEESIISRAVIVILRMSKHN